MSALLLNGSKTFTIDSINASSRTYISRNILIYKTSLLLSLIKIIFHLID